MRLGCTAFISVICLFFLGACRSTIGTSSSDEDISGFSVSPSFLKDVVPVIVNSGSCTSAGCHGQGSAQGGLNLDFSDAITPDSSEDLYEALIANSAWVNQVNPDESRLIRAPLGENHPGQAWVSLGGENSTEYITVLRWIETGVAP